MQKMPMKHQGLIISFMIVMIWGELFNTTCAEDLKIDTIQTHAQEWQINVVVSYSNIHNVSGQSWIQPIDIPGSDPIIIPIFLGESLTNRDYFNYTMNLRYDMTNKIGVSAFADFYSDIQRISLGETTITEHDDGLTSLGMGITYELLEPGKYPALILSGSCHLLDNVKLTDQSKKNYFKTISMSATTYYMVDPIVFLLEATYQYNFSKDGIGIADTENTSKEQNIRLDQGEMVSISPKVLFAVNPYTSLNWGLQWTFLSPDRIDNQKISSEQTNMSLLFGVGYELTTSWTLTFDTEYQNSANLSQTTASLGLTYRF